MMVQMHAYSLSVVGYEWGISYTVLPKKQEVEISFK